MRVAVVGGGMTGLCAAYEARLRGHDVVVHEAGERPGGKLLTTPLAGRMVDEGADAFLARFPDAVELCRELGIEGELVSPASGVAYLYVDGALRPMPRGTVLGVPTDLSLADQSGILSRPVAHRPAPRPLAADEDPSVGSVVRAQFGDEVLERMVDPLIGGINAGDSDRLSIRAVAPQLATAAERDRDLLAGLKALHPASIDGPPFYSPRGGMGALVDALLGALGALGVEVRTCSAVSDLEALDADAILLATPGWVTAELVRQSAPGAAALLGAIRYASVAVVSIAVDRASVVHPLEGSGFLVPRSEGLLLTACSWATSKWSHLARDDGLVVMRASAGRIGDTRAEDLNDTALVERLLRDLSTTMGTDLDPHEVRVSRWPRGFPQYEPGHLTRVEEIERSIANALPRVRVAGAALRGLGVPACIRQGREAAASLCSDVDAPVPDRPDPRPLR